MKYKVNFEPSADIDCLYIITAIINNESIENAMENIIKKRGKTIYKKLEPYFRDAIDLEEQMKNELHFNIPEYEEYGREIAEFLFKKRERLDNAPVAVIYFYDQLKKHTGEENLKLVILSYLMPELFFSKGWDISPPSMETDKAFFDILDENLSDAVEKYEMIKLYYNFDFYHDYTLKLLEHAAAIYKKKQPVFREAIDACMGFISDRLNERGADFLQEKLGITIGDDFEHTLIPSIYHINSLSMQGSEPRWPVHIVIGIHLFDVIKVIEENHGYDNQNLHEFLKCIADGTKLSILRHLKEESMYGSQLAEKLNLTGATISHHLSAMLNLEIILMEKKSNRVYCSLNRDKIEQYLDDAKLLI